MRAIIQAGYGAPRDVLALGEAEAPEVPDAGVLVRVRVASVNPADWHMIRGAPYFARASFGLREPKHTVPGCDLAGTVEAVGAGVERFRAGDEVLGCTFMRGMGAFAEVAAVAEELLAPKPATPSFERAAAVPLAALTALQGLRDHGRVEPGQRVLVIGASGGVGTFAVQIAKSLGAEVTGVCGTRNVDLVRSLGADHVIDYTSEDFTAAGRTYDLVFQAAGTASALDCRRVLTPKGTMVLISGDSSGRWIGPLARTVAALAVSPFLSQKVATFTMSPNGSDLRVLTELVEEGKVEPVIDREYPLADAPEAIAYQEEGHANGKVVIGV
jgi:NADPH:quinone reductase-like Zn-dependent oxidoreductase